MAWGSRIMSGNAPAVEASATGALNGLRSEMTAAGMPTSQTPAAAPAASRPQRMAPTDMNTTGLRSQRSRDVAAQINAGRAQRRADIAAEQPVPALADGGMVGKSCEETGRVGSLHGKNMKK